MSPTQGQEDLGPCFIHIAKQKTDQIFQMKNFMLSWKILPDFDFDISEVSQKVVGDKKGNSWQNASQLINW